MGSIVEPLPFVGVVCDRHNRRGGPVAVERLALSLKGGLSWSVGDSANSAVPQTDLVD